MIDLEQIDRYLLLCGNSLDELKKLPDNCIDSVVCDPPYHLTSIVDRYGKKDSKEPVFGNDGSFGRLSKGFMNQEWDGGDIAFQPDIWKECYRVLKPGGYLLAFGFPKNYHRLAVAIEDSKFEIRDCCMFLFGTGFPKSHNVGLNIDKHFGYGNRGKAIPTASSYQASDKDKNNKLEAHKVESYEAKTELGKKYAGYGSNLKPAYEPIVMARKPLIGSMASNVIEYGTGGINVDAGRYSDENRFPANVIINEDALEGLTADQCRYFYSPKASKKDKNEGCDSFTPNTYSNDGRDKTIDNPFQRGNAVSKNDHPTVKPTELMRYLVKLVTPEGGLVLDPFCGSGSTGKACIMEDFKFIGIDLSQHYLDIAEARISYVLKEKNGE